MSYLKKINKLTSNLQKEINNTYIWTSIVRKLLEKTLYNDELIEDDILEFILNVPSYRRNKISDKIVKRSKENIRDILNDAIKYNIYYSTWTLYISMFENFLEQIAYIILDSNPEKLMIDIGVVKKSPLVSYENIELSKSNQYFRDILIKDQVRNLSYISTNKLKAYFETVLELSNLDDEDNDIWNKFKSYKMIRNVIVHNLGYIDDIYISKSMDSKYVIGEKIEISNDMLSDISVTLKHFSGKIAVKCKTIDSFYKNIKISTDYQQSIEYAKLDLKLLLEKKNIYYKIKDINIYIIIL